MQLSLGLLLAVSLLQKTDGTIFGIRIRDAPQQYRPQYKPQYKPNIFDGVAGLKAGALRSGANALRFKGDVFHNGANILDNTANGFSPSQALQQRPSPQTSSAQLNFLNAFGNNLQSSYNSPSYKPPSSNNDFNSVISNNNNINEDSDVITINNQGPFTSGRDPDVIVGDPRAVDPGLLRQAQQIMLEKQKMNALRTELMRVKDASTGPKISQCEERFTQLVGDIFIGNEMVPDVIETPPKYPLELTYRTVRTFPGMRVTAETTKFKPMVEWPAEDGAYYTLVLANLDINTRRNRTLAEFWHWFVANIPGDSVDDGEVIFDLLFPLVLPEGDGDHRFGYFVMKQPRRLDYASEGGPTDSCSPDMSKGRGPRRSVKELIRKYDLELTASTFLILDSDPTSLEIACEWQRCMGGQVRCPSDEV